MSINLLIAGYCEDCEEFEPEVEKDIFKMFGGKRICTTDIKCVHENKCEKIFNYLDEKKGE